MVGQPFFMSSSREGLRETDQSRADLKDLRVALDRAATATTASGVIDALRCQFDGMARLLDGGNCAPLIGSR